MIFYPIDGGFYPDEDIWGGDGGDFGGSGGDDGGGGEASYLGAVIKGRICGSLVLIFYIQCIGVEGVDDLADLDPMLHCRMNLSEANV